MMYFNPCFHLIIMSGFLRGHLCCIALVKMVDDWCLALDSKKVTGSIAIDLSKAFDSICHNLLLVKLRAYGIGEEAIDFLHSYLSGWKQRVKVNGVFTDWLPVYCGVPQGHSCLMYLSTIWVFLFNSLPWGSMLMTLPPMCIQYRQSLILVCCKLFVHQHQENLSYNPG